MSGSVAVPVRSRIVSAVFVVPIPIPGSVRRPGTGVKMEFEGKKVLVVGLGLSGFSAAALLAREGARVKVTESGDSDAVAAKRDILAGKGIEVETGGHTKGFCRGNDLIVMSPGIPANHPAGAFFATKDVPVIGELELGYLFCQAPIIAVTGTNGKTTTVSMLGKIFDRAGRYPVVCGNMGKPLSGEVDGIDRSNVVIAEVSSFQLETTKTFRPRVAVLLNVSDDHYGRHGNMENYKRHKFKIFSNQCSSDRAVLRSDLASERSIAGLKSKVVFFGGPGARYRAEDDRVMYVSGGKEQVFLTSEHSGLEGRHNMENAACCAQVAEIWGISADIVRSALENFSLPLHRFQRLGCAGGVFFIDDSKATNVDAAKRALEAVDVPVVLIAGGEDKLGDYSVLIDLAEKKIKAMVVLGEARRKIMDVFSDRVEVHEALDMSDAVKRSVSIAGEGGTVMLSPMCSSFDMFDSYSHRGEVFRREIEKLCGPLYRGIKKI